jgi:hypothetical protein
VDRRPQLSPQAERRHAALLDAILAEHHRRGRGQAPRARFDRAVRRQASRIYEQYLEDLCRRIRRQRDGELDEHDRRYADQLHEHVHTALWHATQLLPALDPHGHPVVDQEGCVCVPDTELGRHFGQAEQTRRGPRGTPQPPYGLADEPLQMSLGILAVRPALRVGRYRNGYGLKSDDIEALARAVEEDGWQDCMCTETMALEVLAEAVEAGEVVPLGASLRIVRAKRDPRTRLAAGGLGAGGCVLTLETLIVCETARGAPLVARVLDEPAPETDLEQLAQLAWGGLRRVARQLPEMPRIAVLPRRLPLGPSANRRSRSRIREPGADEARAADANRVAAADLLVVPVGDEAVVRVAEGSDVLERWTVVALAEWGMTPAQTKRIEAAVDPLAAKRELTVRPTQQELEAIDDMLVMHEPMWVVSRPRDAAQPLGEALALARGALAVEDAAYPRRAAGHRVAFAGTNDPAKVDAVMQILLAYTLAEELDRLLAAPAPAP